MKLPVPNVRKSFSGINVKSLLSKKTFQTLFSRGFWRSLADTPDATRFLAGFLIFILLTAGSFVVVAKKSANGREMIQHASELRVLSQDIAKNSTEASSGNQQAFDSLNKAIKTFNERWDSLKEMHGDDRPETKAVQTVWQRVSDNLQKVSAGEKTVGNLHDLVAGIADAVPELQAENDSIVEAMVASGAPSAQVVVAKNQSVLAERILRSVSSVLNGDENAVMAADDFGRDSEAFGQTLEGLLNGDPDMGVTAVKDEQARASLTAIQKLFESSVQQGANEILQSSPELFQVREASNAIFRDSPELLSALTKLTTTVDEEANAVLASIIGVASLMLTLVSLFGFIRVRARQDKERAEKESEIDRKRAEEVEMENQRNQSAILRLLDELGDLADGDLTVQATVSEDFTGAIADSINYSIDQLRQLVSTINQTAVQVSAAAQETQSTAMHLAEASEHQAQEIAGASAAVNEMAVSIDQVSANAAESAVVADRSVAIAHKGADVVQRSIEGMDTIREQIQETSKRIKRLGESSQEIGDIVSLINDIADQTNILALNAAIQASMAGEAGRGFAVVADEVQRLAERSASATKQIEQLVKTIQSDTNEAVISMEQTTSEVVRGARLAQDAGVALEEIQTVSRNLADLIQNISNAARQQAASAGHISNTMNVIQEITTQTTAGTIATARSIGNLAEMAAELRLSVSGFKLPDYA
ncbi:MAG: type IV pili methyl-accepting chemotaxis transducer N-terminal domain-containing protein [Moraxellaceae bacterium]|nr:type IV pili methyl-accepting chemotaxis transducer N-terminal domain-containing protein [Moraxellaceae bacterium]